jgi:hypothetical protein
MQSNSDTVNVRLTAAGQAAAKGGPLSVHGGAMTLTFTGSAVQPVHRAIWFQTLAPTAPFGQPWFELAPAASTAPSPVAAPVAKPIAAASPAPVPVHTNAQVPETFIEAEHLGGPVLHPSSAVASVATTSAPEK